MGVRITKLKKGRIVKKEYFNSEKMKNQLQKLQLLSLIILCAGSVFGQNVDTTSNWMAEIQKDISQREYHISEGFDHRLQSPNRAQNLRFNYFPTGFEMNTRVDSLNLETWKVRIEFEGIYRGDQTMILPSKNHTQEIDNNHLQYHHDGGLTLEYFNDMAGMRQNFIIDQKPIGEGLLKVKLNLITSLIPSLNAQNEIVFSEQQSAKVKYKDLKVIDANGVVIQAWMELDNNELALVVNDENAAYPLTIDPLSTAASTFLDENQASANFGRSVSSAGDVNGDGYSDVIVGAYYYDSGESNEGVAFIYHGSASGINSTASTILESNQAGANLGYSVSSAGDVNGDGYSDVIVGVPYYNTGGAALIYHGSSGGVSTSYDAILEFAQVDARFGHSVSSAGDVNGDGYSDVIVGAVLYDDGQTDEGAAFIYHGTAGGINTTASLSLYGNQVEALMGSSVSSAGDVNGDGYSDIIVGAMRMDFPETDEGMAYIYLGSISGVTPMVNANLQGNVAGAVFGASVSSAGDVNGDGYSDVIVGSSNYEAGGNNSTGAVYIYHGSSGGVDSFVDLFIEGTGNWSYLGASVSSAGDVNGDGYGDVIVGQPHAFGTNEKAFVYSGGTGGITLASKVTLSQSNDADFGVSVSSAGDVNGDGYSDVIVGANTYGNEGAAFTYHGSASGISTNPHAALEANQTSANLGYSVSSAGDVNGDGYSDVIVGAYHYDSGQTDEGIALVYHGSFNGLFPAPNQILEGNQASAFFGTSVSSAGDVNGDGYGDVIIGANAYDNGETNEGVAFIFHGSAGGVSNSADLMLEGNQTSAYFGRSVSSAGDVNGDGYSDVIIGANGYDNGEIGEGAAFIYHGSAVGVNATASNVLESNQAGGNMGYSVSTAGDVNGDGYSDVIIGAIGYTNGQSDEGAAFIYHGSVSGIVTTDSTMVESNQANANFGYGVSGAGDVNGDGFSDVIVGAYTYGNGESNEGAAFIYHGSINGINTTYETIVESDQVSAQMGTSVSGAGDVNGDGYSDVIVGAHYYDNGESNEGAAFVYLGGSTGIIATASAMMESDQADAYMGWSVSGAGDVNGDGYSDVIVGAHNYDNPHTDEGAAYVYFGNDGGGLSRTTRQYKSDLTTPVQTGNSSFESQFGIGHFARSSNGRVKAKLVWEVFSEGNSFTGSPITNSVVSQGESATWTDLNTTGIEIKELMSSVGLYNKWRVRVKYHPATMLNGQVYSRWFYGGIHDENEMSIRPCPILADLASIQPITVDCNETLTAPTATNACGGTLTGTTSDVLSFVEGGSTTITWTFDAGGGNSTTAEQVYYYDDVTPPVVEPFFGEIVDCNGTLTPLTAIDDCEGIITGTTTDLLSFVEGGITIVTWTFDDGNGNISTQGQGYLYDDVTPPVTPTLSSLTVGCSGTLTPPTTTDDCAGIITGTTTGTLNFVEGASTTITWTFDDGNGNTTTADQIYNYDDATAPTTPTLSSLTVGCSGTLTTPTTTDDCAGTITGTTTGTLTFVEGDSTTITWTFDDGNGNTTTADQMYYYDDVSAPFSPFIGNVTVDCNGVLVPPTTTDLCTGLITGTTTDVLSFVEGGSTTITWTFDDGNGNSITADQIYNYDDVTAPITPTISPVTIDCNGTLTGPTTTDDCSGIIIGTTTGTLIYVEGGATTITWTFDDGNGNSTTADQVYNYDDVTAPVAGLGSLADINDVCEITTLIDPTANDNCSAVTVTNDVTLPITSNTTITWTYTDASGNASTQTQDVVLSDLVVPTASNPADSTYECIGDAVIDVAVVTDESDNCSTTTVAFVSDVSDGQTCPETITRTYSVTDGSGNSIDVIHTIIIQDVSAPTASNPISLNVQCIGDVPAPVTGWVSDEADNCSSPVVAFVGDVSDGLTCPETITRTFSVTDDCGNQTTVEQLIVVLDIEAPTADLPVLPELTGNCDITPTTATASDNCDASINGTPDVAFPITAIGTTTVTWTYTDACGNASTQTQDVIINAIDVSTTMANDNITILANNNPGSGVTYQWIDCVTGQPITGEINHNYTPTYGSDFAVIITEDGCSDTSACVNSTVGIKELEDFTLNIYPNPSSNGVFYINSTTQVNALVVYDAIGRIVTVSYNPNNGVINAENLAPGKYIVKLLADDFLQVRELIIVQN